MKEALRTAAQREHCSITNMMEVLSKPIIDKIDLELAKLFGLSDEETDFIINYDIEYRMGGVDDET